MKIIHQLKQNRWTAVVAVFVMALSLLPGCTTGTEQDSNGTTFPTATLHPVFASGEEFDEHLRETRDAEMPEDLIEEEAASPTPRPSPTDAPPVFSDSTPSPTPRRVTATPPPPEGVPIQLNINQEVITASVLPLYDEELNADWIIEDSSGIQFDTADESNPHNGDFALSFQPEEDLSSLFFKVRPDADIAYRRADIDGVAFWLYTGSEPLAPDDLALVVTGSNELPYWDADDLSVDPDEYEPSFEDARFELGFNQVVSPTTWVQVIVFLDDLAYETDYLYITGLNLVNNVDVSRRFLIDELVLILREP